MLFTLKQLNIKLHIQFIVVFFEVQKIHINRLDD